MGAPLLCSDPFARGVACWSANLQASLHRNFVFVRSSPIYLICLFVKGGV